MDKKKIINITYVFIAIITLIGGTFAWLNYRTNSTALVLTVGDVNGMFITIKPYQINGTLNFSDNYSDSNAKVIDITVSNNKTEAEQFDLYFDISAIDTELKESEYFKWKITKSIDDGVTYSNVEDGEGDFTSANINKNFIIYSEEVAENTTNPSYKYKVYIWLENDDDPNADQSNLQNKIFNAELRASFGQTIQIGTTWDFDYNGTNGNDGSIQEFLVPTSGIYKLEVWGAQGGNASLYTGGYGGYSVGNVTLSKRTIVYINIGGKGADGVSLSGDVINAGGYNGGGYAYGTNVSWYKAGGGGATHMATHTGLLSSLYSYQSSLFIVAGGGGGSVYNSSSGAIGGHAGGYIGNSSSFSGRTCTGGSQTAGGECNSANGSFGQGGGYNISNTFAVGGGGGYYGGSSGQDAGGGAGGSSYIGNPNLTDKIMYCYNCAEDSSINTFTVSTTGNSNLRDTINCSNGYSNNPVSKCAKTENGYARITFIGR